MLFDIHEYGTAYWFDATMLPSTWGWFNFGMPWEHEVPTTFLPQLERDVRGLDRRIVQDFHR